MNDLRLDKVFNAIKKFIKDNGIPPTVRDLCTLTGINSTSMMRMYLTQLEELEKIERKPWLSRSIVVKDG